VTAFTIEELRSRATRNLLRNAPLTWNRSDDDMNARARMIPDGIQPKPAAVLIPIVAHSALTCLLTQRTEKLSSHAGQIAFPGGKLDPGETALDAALRETEEETGLSRKFVEPLGYLDGYLTITGYVITPVVALVQPGFTLAPHADEVDDVFEVPLAFLMNSANRERHTRDWQGLPRHYYAYPYGNRYIWGATAGMLKNLSDRLHA
jgi:8-oxo-dGTP pyrophosphatase MutT (NUDIX family)